MAEVELPRIESWFWILLESTKFDSTLFATTLDELSELRLEKFVAFFELAAQYTRDPWDGPFIDEIGAYLSEDSTTDLNEWVVAQGIAAWEYAQLDHANWNEIFRLANDALFVATRRICLARARPSKSRE